MDKPMFTPGAPLPVVEVGPRDGLVKAWSFSSLKEFEKCPLRTKFGKVDRIEVEQHPAAERGQNIHDKAEKWITGDLADFPKELKHFEKGFSSLREGYGEGAVIVEEPWAFTLDWDITDWSHDECWLRMKLDAFVQETDTSAVVIDFKTGKRDGNEISHTSQAQIYAIGAFMRNPGLQYVKAEFWYLDFASKNRLVKEYTRDKAMMFLPKWNERGIKMTSCTEFHPTPSKFNCKWCSFKDNCEWAVDV